MVMAYKKVVGADYVPENYTTANEKRKVKTSRKPGWILRITPGMLCIALIFLLGMSFVAQHVWINFLGFQITEIKKEIVNLQTDSEKLKLKIANTCSLEKVEEVAVKEMGMIYPNDKSVHYIFSPQNQENKKSAVPQIAELLSVTSATGQQKETTGNNFPKRAWLGIVEDFFSHWLAGDL